MLENLVLLHGFSATRRSWDGVIARLPPERYRPLALDLPGHGAAADASGPITFDGCVAHVLDRSPDRFVLAGYSMGGRIALHVALAVPECVERLVLVSTSAGIENGEERARRSRLDRLLADELEREPFEDFIERWRSQPLFAEEPRTAGMLAREDQRRNRPDALAAALRGVGTGEMNPLWDRLAELEMRVTVVVGERDPRFCTFGERMVSLLPDADLVVASGGHGLLLESPQAVAGAISQPSTGETGPSFDRG